MAFDPSLVLDPDPRVRLVNAYEAVLSYCQARLSAGDYILLLAALAAADLPTTAAGILTLPTPQLYVDAASILAMNFVTQPGRELNPSTIATAPQVVPALRVDGDVTLGAGLVADNVIVGDDLSVAGDATLAVVVVDQDIDVAGAMTVGGGIGIGKVAPANGLDAAGPVKGDRLIVTQVLAPASASAGTLAEDASGDLYYKDLGGTTRYINRPQHDTGWIDLAAAGSYGPTGPLGVYAGLAAVPAQTPDIYAGTPMTLGGAVGDPGGPTRVQVWFRADESAFSLAGAPPAATGTDVACPVAHHTALGSNANMRGVMVSFDQVTNQVSITLSVAGGIPLIAGFGYTDVFTYAATYGMELRVMIWTR